MSGRSPRSPLAVRVAKKCAVPSCTSNRSVNFRAYCEVHGRLAEAGTLHLQDLNTSDENTVPVSPSPRSAKWMPAVPWIAIKRCAVAECNRPRDAASRGYCAIHKSQERENDAAIVIQKIFRGSLQRKSYERLVVEKLIEEEKQLEEKEKRQLEEASEILDGIEAKRASTRKSIIQEAHEFRADNFIRVLQYAFRWRRKVREAKAKGLMKSPMNKVAKPSFFPDDLSLTPNGALPISPATRRKRTAIIDMGAVRNSLYSGALSPQQPISPRPTVPQNSAETVKSTPETKVPPVPIPKATANPITIPLKSVNDSARSVRDVQPLTSGREKGHTGTSQQTDIPSYMRPRTARLSSKQEHAAPEKNPARRSLERKEQQDKRKSLRRVTLEKVKSVSGHGAEQTVGKQASTQGPHNDEFNASSMKDRIRSQMKALDSSWTNGGVTTNNPSRPQTAAPKTLLELMDSAER